MNIWLSLLISFGLMNIQKIYKGSGRLLFEINLEESESQTLTFFIASEGSPPYVKIIQSGSGSSQNPEKIELKCASPISYYGLNLYPYTLETSGKIKSALIEVEYDPNFSVSLPRAIKQALKGIVLNIEDINEAPPGGYVIIVPDVLYNDFLPLAKWKELKGYSVIMKKHSEFNPLNATNIKNFITSLWIQGNPRPEFVLLVDTTTPSFRIPVFNEVNLTDLPYGQIDSDIFPEILVGRVVATNRAQAITIVKKIMEYERNPLRGGSEWLKRALVIGSNYPSFMTSPILVKKKVRLEFLRAGYYEVDTVYWGSGYSQTTQDISSSINRGVAFVNYRGGDADPWEWINPQFNNTNIQNLSNGWRLPIVTSIVCNTARFNHPQCFGTYWLIAGDTINPRGAVAFYGATTPTTHTRWNNCLDYGFYGGLLVDSINILGALTLRSKLEVFKNFYDGSQANSDTIAYNFYAYNLLGDPSLEVWTDIPESLVVLHPSALPSGRLTFSVRVLDRNSTPLKKALVSILKTGEIKQSAYTDESGFAIFTVETSSQDTAYITVTARNKVPYLGKILITPMNYVGYYQHLISDSEGNNDGNLNPGERVSLFISLKNYGNSTISNVIATLSSTDPNINIESNNVINYGNINPGQVLQGGPIIIRTSNNIKNGYMIRINLAISSSAGNFSENFYLRVFSPSFTLDSIRGLSDTFIISPGDTSSLVVFVSNTGNQNANDVFAILRSGSQFITVLDSTSYLGSINSGSSGSNQSEPFLLAAPQNVPPGIQISCTLVVYTSTYSEEIPLKVIIGQRNYSSPLGPDEYGYYAYDNTESHRETPVYQWIEIDPDYGGQGTPLPLKANDIKTVNLPFPFKFYGIWYSQISISSEGYIVLGEWQTSDRYNWTLPSVSAPPSIIAPFWDDLNPQAGGKVVYHFDNSGQRFIVEWSRVPRSLNVNDTLMGPPQTFEFILFNPTYYPTLTGDGIIQFQYKEITNNDDYHKFATTGIQNHTRSVGLLYTYNNEYPSQAAPLISGRAIRFTTNPPGTVEINERTSHVTSKILLDKIARRTVLLNPELLKLEGVSVIIYDNCGRTVKILNNNELKKLEGRINLEGLNSGIYFVVLAYKNRMFTEMFIKVE
jgi:hypothetical protein